VSEQFYWDLLLGSLSGLVSSVNWPRKLMAGPAPVSQWQVLPFL
jgi:hypothetical protein